MIHFKLFQNPMIVILSVAKDLFHRASCPLQEVLRYAQDDTKRDSTERNPFNDVTGQFRVLGWRHLADSKHGSTG